MHYYLGGWTTDRHGYRPTLDTEGDWSVVDLRPDAARRDGLCLFAAPERIGRDRGGLYLGDADEKLPLALHALLGNRLGVNLARRRWRWLVADLLTEHARTDGTRWRPLRPVTTLVGRTVARAWEIWLGGRLLHLPIPSGGAAYAEPFTGADNTSLAAATVTQTWTDVVAGWGVLSNQGYVSSSGAVAYARAAATSATDDTFASFTLITKTDAAPTDYSQVAPCVRFDGAANTSYMACRGQDTDTSFNLRKTVGGGRSQLNNFTTAIALPEVVRCDAAGSTISALINGVPLATVTDTSIPTGTQGGIYGFRPTVTESVVIDNWAFGDLIRGPRPIVGPGGAATFAAASR